MTNKLLNMLPRTKSKHDIRVFSFVAMLLLLDAFFIYETNDISILLVAIIWFFVIFMLKIDNGYSLVISLLMFILMPIFLTFEFERFAEKAAVWSYVFLVLYILREAKSFLRQLPE